ncbi:VOC family protein [Actinoplanes sp. NPDC051411]|uniref:VOC family protein n=1 Tax=Actinoplanes sp. NPDC051411 TaxID=3155522 RepID=UPI003446E710
MQIGVQAAVPVLYVRSVESAEQFYALFGYAPLQSGRDGDARWSYLQAGEQTLLLACVQPPLIQAELPLLIYLYVTDLAALRERLNSTGHPHELVGQPEHAPGGEIRTRDPDGNVVLAGQRSAAAGHTTRPTEPRARFSLLREAAEAVSRRGGAPSSCQIGEADGSPCPLPAEVKLADPWGSTVWGCLAHTEEALINAPAAFIATDDAQGLGPWLSHRTATRPDPGSTPPEA